MKRALSIQKEVQQIDTIEGLTSVFESIASIHIAQIKGKVTSSIAFFNELWHLYNQLRLGEGSTRSIPPTITDRPAVVAVTSDSGLSGDIDERIIDAMLAHTTGTNTDIYVIGDHGASLLSQRRVVPRRVFPLPDTEQDMVVAPIVQVVNQYKEASVYYQTYVSLLRQDIARIELFSAVEALSERSRVDASSPISSEGYIFEPSLLAVIEYMESIMVGVALGQVILESKLAQYASRFNAMNAAKTKAREMQGDLRLQLNRVKRAQSDERIKEVLSALKVRGKAGRE
jgi:ATP synthase F1 gamma subunit